MDNIWIFLRTVVNSSAPLALLFIMSSFRCKRTHAWTIAAVITSFSVLADIILLVTAGREVMMQFFAVILGLPTVITLLLMTNDRPSQIFFNFFTAVNLLYLASIIGHILGGTDQPWFDVVARSAIFLLALFLFQRYLAEPYRFLARNMGNGWIMVAVVPFLFFALVMFMGLYPSLRYDNFYSVLFLYIILFFFYYMIYQTFRSTYDLLRQMDTDRLLSYQVAMMKTQLEEQEKSNSQIRLLRHDLRHFISNISTCLREGRSEEALRFLEKYEEQFQQIEIRQYCKEHALNSLLSRYLDQARSKGIEVRTCLDIPETLPVDVFELCIVLSNALENAIQASAGCAVKRLKICFVSHPSFGIKIINSCETIVKFDEHGYPTTDEPGHGYGIRSIAAFAKKYHALLSYEQTDGEFTMMLLLQKQP